MFRVLAFAAALGLHPVLAGSNFVSGDYPDPDCGEKPVVPVRPDSFESEAEVIAYNERVSEYNSRVDVYFRCVQDYVDNAAEDIQTIRTKTRQIVEHAND